MYQDSDVICLIMCVISSGFIGRLTDKDIPQFRFFYGGLLFMCVSFFASVVEGFLWPTGFNFIEHLCSATSGVLFAIACFNLCRTQTTIRNDIVELSPCETVKTVDLVWVKNR
jgi:hypothetical protein